MKILAISYSFPPDSFPRSIQVSRLLAALPAESYVFCASDEDASKDPSIMPLFPDSVQEERLPVKSSLLGACLWVACRRLGGLPRKLSNPARSWASSTTRAAMEAVKQGKFSPDLLVSFGEPSASHMVALALKKEFKFPWIAHFSDPWSDSPYLPVLARRAERLLEKEVVEHADAVLVTSRETLELISAKYPAGLRKKFQVLNHAFDASRFPDIPPERGVLRHIGSFYGIRTPNPFLKGLAVLRASKPGLTDKLKIEFIGSLKKGLLDKALVDSLPPGMISFKPHVPYQKSLDLAGSAWGLLVLDAMTDNSVFFPSKLVEYLGSGRPVLAVTPKDSASARIVRDSGGWVASPDNPAEIATVFEDFIGRASTWDQNAARTTAAQYDISTVSKNFMGICKNIIDK